MSGQNKCGLLLLVEGYFHVDYCEECEVCNTLLSCVCESCSETESVRCFEMYQIKFYIDYIYTEPEPIDVSSYCNTRVIEDICEYIRGIDEEQAHLN